MYCPNCSERFKSDEGFCPKCGWKFGNGAGESHNKEASSVRPKMKAMDDFGFYHWDLVHVDQRLFPVGK